MNCGKRVVLGAQTLRKPRRRCQAELTELTPLHDARTSYRFHRKYHKESKISKMIQNIPKQQKNISETIV